MKKLLIIGASILQLPTIKRAKELGYYVGVIDYNPNAIGILHADEYFEISTIDIQGIIEIARRFKPNGIITAATDMPVRSVAAVVNELGLCGISPDTALKATDKGEMIKTFVKHNVASPWFYILNGYDKLKSVCKNLSYPCIIKPIDNAGSRGVVLVNNPSELESSYEYSKSQSRSGTVIIEEYMSGSEVSVEIICINGEPHIIAVTDKLTTGAPYFVEMGHSQQSQLEYEKIEAIKRLASDATKAIGIDNGPVHVEIMLTDEGPKMVELGARMGGDCITSHLVPLSTGVDMIEATIRLACGENINVIPKLQKGSAIRYISASAGKVENITGIDEAMAIDGIKEIVLNKNTGDLVTNINSSADRIGFVIAQADTVQDAIRACEVALEKIKVEIGS